MQWPAILEPTRKIYYQPQASQKRYIEYICNIYVYSNVEIAGMKNLQTGMQLLYKSLLHLPPFFVGSLVEDVQKICNNKHGGKKQKKKKRKGMRDALLARPRFVRFSGCLATVWCFSTEKSVGVVVDFLEA